ncbi:MAG: aminotransferase class I/II-fold pyridoxal phosphate-dependent enzyme [Candidatus Lokiarchaeota archaeon]|nr:aminotransferase class I/II-fold pyridoxal phosphate-dependent enzyme [Candidatus Lokiarchaeota archaeon]
MVVSKRIKEISYAIREIAAVANEVAKSGKKIYHLNIGDPVIYDFKTPQYISQALADASFGGKNFYVDSMGALELREEIARSQNQKNNLNLHSDDVLVTSGVTEAIFFLIAALIEDKKELLIPGPSYPLYINYAKFFEGVPVEYELDEENEWEPNIDDLRNKITDKTQALLICSPNNPTGVMFSEKMIKKIIDIAGEYDLTIISDEIYDQITYEKPFTCPASLSKDVPVIGLNGFSKSHLATGWRLGYMYYHDPENKLGELREGIAKMARARLSASSVAQYAAIKILKNPGTHTKEMVAKLKERRDYSYERLRKIEGITCVKPNGAFYLFPKLNFNEFKKWNDDKEFVIDLLKTTGICTVYGSGFGEYGKDHVRFTFLPTKDILETVYNNLEEFIG